MAAKYSKGTRVRVRAKEHVHQVWRSHVQQFDGMTGEVVSSVQTIGYVTHAWAEYSIPPVQTILFYRVLLDIGVEVDFVTEDLLEEVETS